MDVGPLRLGEGVLDEDVSGMRGFDRFGCRRCGIVWLRYGGFGDGVFTLLAIWFGRGWCGWI